MTALEQRIENEPCFTLADIRELIALMDTTTGTADYFRAIYAAKAKAHQAVTNPKSRIRS